MNQESAQIAVTQVQKKLDRIKSYIIESRKGNITPADQRAIRLLASRHRLLQRLYDRAYGPEEAKVRAKQELNLETQDRGDLLTLAGRQHAIGRLDCRACDCNYDSAFPKPLARVCSVCGKGVMHAYTVVEEKGGTPTTTNPQVIDSRGSQGDLKGYPVVYQSRYFCEFCSVTEPRELV